MRKLKLQMQQTIDGYVCGPNGELDWMLWNWDDELKKFVTDLTDSTDLNIMGRKLAQGFIPYWQNVISNPSDPQYDFGKKMVDTPKIVFTHTLNSNDAEVSAWKNTVLSKNKPEEELARLKKEEGKDIIVYGGASFVSSLIEKNLVDELYLFINPAAIGNGLSIFNGRTDLVLDDTLPFSCGITILKFKPAKK